MPTLRTHYQNLKVDEKAPASVIKAAYRALSLEYHPDRRKGDPDADRIFKIIQNSYEILSDPVQRQKHDDWIKSQRDSSSNQGHKKESSDTKKDEPQHTKSASYSRPLAFAVFVIISTVLMWSLGQSEQLDRFLSSFLVKKESVVKEALEVTPLVPKQVTILPSNTDSAVSIADTDSVSDIEAKVVVTESSNTTPIVSIDPIREALLDIYEKANGDDWIYRSNWGVGDYCSWYGITCRDGKVVELVLEDNRVSGEISSKIGILTTLERLILDNFPFRNTPSTYEGLKGEIPSSIGLLAELRVLRLSNNSLSGNIPSIKNLVKLKRLELINNRGLTGPIPEGIENFSELEVLGLSVNRLTGMISGNLSKLTKLRYLGLQSNNFVGEIPPELGDLSNLALLGLGGNNLTGTIPVSFAKLTKLERLFLQNNALTGKVPQFIRRKEFDYLDISGNNFDEEPTDSIREALRDLYEKANGDDWKDNTNWGSGDYCSWYGITCKEGEVVEIRLDRNNLKGTISNKIGDLTSLTHLRLSHGEMRGSIPASIGNLTNLETLGLDNNGGLTGEIPSEIGSLAKLRNLWLGNNQLHGELPSELIKLTSIWNLQLRNNQFSGRVFPLLKEMKDLSILLLGRNNFSGEIPQWIGERGKFTNLDLEDNKFTGSLPQELGNLTNLTSLYLGNNEFTGTIPSSFSQLTNLRHLMLQNNALTGKVPRSILQKKFDRFNISGNNFIED